MQNQSCTIRLNGCTVQTSPPSLLHTTTLLLPPKTVLTVKLNPSNSRCPARQQQPLQFVSGNSYRRREKIEVDEHWIDLIKTESAEVSTPILLNGSAALYVLCNLVRRSLSGRKLTSDISLESFLELGALCCHSGINELDRWSVGPSMLL